MEELVRNLPPTAWVLDLGSGRGSFHCDATQARVLAMDLAFPEGGPRGIGVLATAQNLPLVDHSVDVIVANHTLEHLENLDHVLSEIGRTLKPAGHLWVAVPDGFSFDDRLYRWMFTGKVTEDLEVRAGGHVNRFSFKSLLDRVQREASIAALRWKPLYSGFVYLNSPSAEKLPHYPHRAKRLARVPPRLLRFGLRWLNFVTRQVDHFFGMHLSHYGWAVVFRRQDEPALQQGRPSAMDSDINVCFGCGAGHPEAILRTKLQSNLFWKFYHCEFCGTRNVFVGNWGG